jgi:hypothetical protein
MAEQISQRAPTIDDSTTLAFESMRASYERIMMSWISTATSLITFDRHLEERRPGAWQAGRRLRLDITEFLDKKHS